MPEDKVDDTIRLWVVKMMAIGFRSTLWDRDNLERIFVFLQSGLQQVGVFLRRNNSIAWDRLLLSRPRRRVYSRRRVSKPR